MARAVLKVRGGGVLQVSAAADSPPSDTHPYDATSKTTLTLYTGEWTVFFLIETGIFDAVVPRLIRLVPTKQKPVFYLKSQKSSATWTTF